MKEDDNVIDYLMSQPNVMPRLNERVLSTSAKFIDTTGSIESGIEDISSLSSHQLVAAFSDSISYVSSTTKALTPITTWIIADVTQKAGRQLVLNALEYVRNSRLIRLSVLHNPESITDSSSQYIDAIDAALSSNDIKLLEKLLKTENAEAIISGAKSGSDFGVEPAQKSSFGVKLHHLVATRVLDFQPGQRGLVANGRVIGNTNKFPFCNRNLIEFLQFCQQGHWMMMKISHQTMSPYWKSIPCPRQAKKSFNLFKTYLNFIVVI